LPRVRELSNGDENGAQTTMKLPLARDEHLDIGALERWLWDAACIIRGATDAPKFKDFILPLVFYNMTRILSIACCGRRRVHDRKYSEAERLGRGEWCPTLL